MTRAKMVLKGLETTDRERIFWSSTMQGLSFEDIEKTYRVLLSGRYWLLLVRSFQDLAIKSIDELPPDKAHWNCFICIILLEKRRNTRWKRS